MACSRSVIAATASFTAADGIIRLIFVVIKGRARAVEKAACAP